jgi:hypothetical protein
MASQNVLNMSLYEHFFKGLSLYFDAGIWIRIRIRVEVGSGSASASNKNADTDADDTTLPPKRASAF